MEKSCKSLEEEIFFLNFVYTHLFWLKRSFEISLLEMYLRSTQVLRLKWDNVNLWQALIILKSSVNSDSIFSIDKMTIKMLSGTFTCCSNVPKQTQTKHLSPGRPMVTKLNTRGNTGWIFITVFWGESAPQTWIFFCSIEGVLCSRGAALIFYIIF